MARTDGAVGIWDTTAVVRPDRTGPLLRQEALPGPDPPAAPGPDRVEPDVVVADPARRPGAGNYSGAAVVRSRARASVDHRTGLVEVADRDGRQVRHPAGTDFSGQRRIGRTTGLSRRRSGMVSSSFVAPLVRRTNFGPGRSYGSSPGCRTALSRADRFDRWRRRRPDRFRRCRRGRRNHRSRQSPRKRHRFRRFRRRRRIHRL